MRETLCDWIPANLSSPIFFHPSPQPIPQMSLSALALLTYWAGWSSAVGTVHRMFSSTPEGALPMRCQQYHYPQSPITNMFPNIAFKEAKLPGPFPLISL